MNILNPFMSDPAETMMVTTAAEFEKILAKGAVGTPVVVGDTTVVPLLITTFGIGAGGGSILGEAVGGGGGGGVIPCAVLVFGPGGVELKTLPHEMTSSAVHAVQRLVSDATARQPKSRVTTTASD